MCIDVRGVLNWKPSSMLKNLFENKDGSKPSLAEVKEFLYDKLAQGYEVIPNGKECDNFDKKRGCLGHPVDEDDEDFKTDK